MDYTYTNSEIFSYRVQLQAIYRALLYNTISIGPGNSFIRRAMVFQAEYSTRATIEVTLSAGNGFE